MIGPSFIEVEGINEQFQSGAQPGSLACGPTDGEQCKKGGWQAFGVFENQGDCVSYVATKGKNPPAGG
ncbi:MAG: hypothetical protein JWR13_3285 [Mycobacterium sp.]|jgi:hypothetical protein|nr:hypothetical protein [Mycobacterium sp.]